MDERDYKLIITLHEQKNITHTAEKLFLSQPAVTHRIKKIEAFLGGKILVRSPKGIIFTPLGEGIIPFINNILSDIDNLKNFASSAAGGVRGTLRLGVSVSFAHYKLPALLKKYKTQFPNVNIDIITNRSTNVYKMLLKNEISLGIIREEFGWSENKKLICSEDICLAYYRKITTEELQEIPYIDYKTDPVFQKKIYDWLNESYPLLANRSIWADNIDTCKELMTQGIGWSILPQICLENFEGYIEPLIFKDGKRFIRNTYALYRATLGELPQVKEFLNLL